MLITSSSHSPAFIFSPFSMIFTLLILAVCRTRVKYEPSIWPCSPWVLHSSVDKALVRCLGGHRAASYIVIMWPYTKWLSDCLCAPQENQCLLPHFLTTLGAQEKTHCINVVISWPRYPPTSITWPYRGLRCRPTEVEYFFEVIRGQVASFKMIAGSSLFFKNSYERCCVYVTMAPHYFAFKLTLDAKI